MRTIIFALLAFILAIDISLAFDYKTTVTYVSASGVFIGAGSDQGVDAGDRVSIYGNEKLIAVMEIIFVSANSSSCRLLESTGIIRVGDQAVVAITDEIETEPLSESSDSAHSQPAPEEIKSQTIRDKSNQLSGRISGGVEAQSSDADFNFKSSEPYLRIRASLDRLGGSHFSLRTNLRTRRTIREADSPRVESEWNNRVYELALVYDDPRDQIEFRAGRMIVNELRGIGYLDGAVADYRVAQHVSVGLFGGGDPDLQNTKLQTDHLKSGIFTTYTSSAESSYRLNGTLAAAGSYIEGEVNREFIYEQIYYSPVRKFSLQQSLELNFNRDWLKDAESSSTTLSSLFFSLNYAPVRALNLSAGYDTRKNYHTINTRTIPDSLFDDAERQGFRGSATVRFNKTIRWQVGASGRNSSGNETDSHTGYTTLSFLNPLESQISASLALRSYSTAYSEGLQSSLRLSRPIGNSLNLSAESGHNNYDLQTEVRTITYNWYRLSGDVNWTRQIYSSTHVEIYSGDEISSTGFGLELGYRL